MPCADQRGPPDLTQNQKDLLRLLVAKHESTGGAAFVFVRFLNGAGVCYPGGDSGNVANDDMDFHQLHREQLITLIPIAANQMRGKPTQRGIALVRNDFALSSDVRLVQARDSARLAATPLHGAMSNLPADQASATAPSGDESTRTGAGPAEVADATKCGGVNPADEPTANAAADDTAPRAVGAAQQRALVESVLRAVQTPVSPELHARVVEIGKILEPGLRMSPDIAALLHSREAVDSLVAAGPVATMIEKTVW